MQTSNPDVKENLEANQKYCAGCDLTKCVSDFHKDKYKSSGLCVYCKDCKSERSRNLRKDNISAYKARRNKQYQDNKEIFREYQIARRYALKQAAPDWDKELTRFVIKEAYELAKIRKKETGMDWHIDHIIPLRGKTISGLHVWNNVQLLPAKINLEKGNKYDTV